MNRLFTVQNVPVTGALPIGLHYSISILLFLLLAGGAVFTPVYEGERTRQTRRFLAAGQSPRTAYAGTLMGCCLLSLCLLLPAALLLSQGAILSTLLRCLPAALFIAVFGSLCCLITAQAQQGGLLACLLALGMLGASGGILPGVMLPETLRKLLPFSPVTWMRLLLTASDGWAGSLAALAACSAVLAVLGGLLYRRRFWKEVRAL